MITRVSGLNTKGVTGGLKQSDNRTSFMHSSNPVVKYDYAPPVNQQPNKSPIWTGTSIVLGSVLFMILYFLVSGAKRA